MRPLLRLTSTFLFAVSLALGMTAITTSQAQAGWVLTCAFNNNGDCANDFCGILGPLNGKTCTPVPHLGPGGVILNTTCDCVAPGIVAPPVTNPSD